MRTLATALVSAVTAGALLAPVTTAEAAPVSSTTTITKDVAARPAPIKMQRSKAYSHYGLPGVKVTAVTGKGTRGKVKFFVNGDLAKKSKIKKGKAKFQMDSAAAPGDYKIVAKFKTRKGKTKVTVYDSALHVNAVEFTVSKAAAAGYDYTPEQQAALTLSGTVKFKGKVATEGYVDIYKDGNVKGGSGSPDYCCMDGVNPDGTFSFAYYSFIEEIAERYPAGDYMFQAFYTPTASFAEYIYSQPIIVHVVP